MSHANLDVDVDVVNIDRISKFKWELTLTPRTKKYWIYHFPNWFSFALLQTDTTFDVFNNNKKPNRINTNSIKTNIEKITILTIWIPELCMDMDVQRRKEQKVSGTDSHEQVKSCVRTDMNGENLVHAEL